MSAVRLKERKSSSTCCWHSIRSWFKTRRSLHQCYRRQHPSTCNEWVSELRVVLGSAHWCNPGHDKSKNSFRSCRWNNVQPCNENFHSRSRFCERKVVRVRLLWTHHLIEAPRSCLCRFHRIHQIVVNLLSVEPWKMFRNSWHIRIEIVDWAVKFAIIGSIFSLVSISALPKTSLCSRFS